jgi:mono/diheme cytochrome c family protein
MSNMSELQETVLRIFIYTLAGCAAFLFLIACSATISEPTPVVEISLVDPQNAPTSVFVDNPALKEGEANYNLYCAHCHGYDGEGQIGNRAEPTLRLGMKVVPPHDSTGHTWQHPDQLLLLSIQDGIQSPLDHFPMPAFKDVLTEAQIMGMIEYMRLWWTDEQRAHQAQVTRQWAEIQASLVSATEEAPFPTTTPE